ncbi:hypothetical protein FRB95_008188 [Tulasnella sp. JGI-2019a]|nr:hypothetical protein FRB93_003897 [Tulasnella sp. JGI-2019a]KAG9027023.1 hypothetical protein FRB95_008188 [Tulasnella sp. JGI-2019a]
MSLESGTYIITNNAFKTLIGRNPFEDRSLLPKPVQSLPPGSDPPMWEILKTGSDYVMNIGGAPATEMDGLVSALLMDPENGSKWCITPQPQHGPNVYTIELADKSKGWVVPTEEPETQVALQPLISTKSIPPQFPATQLFMIAPMNME